MFFGGEGGRGEEGGAVTLLPPQRIQAILDVFGRETTAWDDATKVIFSKMRPFLCVFGVSHFEIGIATNIIGSTNTISDTHCNYLYKEKRKISQ